MAPSGSITGSRSSSPISNGTIAEINGRTCIHFDGYWIKYYEPPPESLEAKKALIEALTRRLFNHVEHGINIPGLRRAEARAAYEAETDPDRKRVNGAMLAGAMFNRAATIFTKLVELSGRRRGRTRRRPDEGMWRLPARGTGAWPHGSPPRRR